MQKSTAQSFKVKLKMIRERESLMFDRDFKSMEWFPNFLILCKPNSEDSNADSGNMENEWNGVIKEIEKVVKRQIEASTMQQKKITSGMSGDMKKMNSKIEEMDKNIDKKMEIMEKKMENMKEDMKKEMNDRMDELKNLLKN